MAPRTGPTGIRADAATAEEASIPGIQKAALGTHIRRTYYSDQGRPVETAGIVVPAAHCEIVYEIRINR
ncbi:hypothetical protein BFF78_27885 [Streptomyces fodineus]|uniref:UbiC transcription regulator-associated domain-containing protein n=1 Tax=Streptomyces fodineus TaxID=1904616 RepID=A0A1D7YFQ2_9ACTN|nr:hypothetical protein BFF78_27885 [Streptomyces fodineus]